MGRDATFYCLTCKKDYYLGYGSYSSWFDAAKTVKDWQGMAEQRPSDAELLKNQNMLKCLTEHEGHDFRTYSSDYTTRRGGMLTGEFGPMGSDVDLFPIDDWEHIDLDPPKE